jgi:O-antigen/teichoic acid export membrane protein
MSLKKKLLGNGIAVVFQKGVRIFEQLILVPFFITAWGAEYYGAWLTLSIVPTMLALSDLGFGTAAANYFVLKYASGATQEAANVSRSGFRIVSIVVIAGIGISAIVLGVLYGFKVFDKSLLGPSDAVLSVSILIVARLISFYTQLFEAYYRAARRASLSINLLSLQAFLNIIAGFVVLTLGYKVVAFAISQLIVSVIFNIGYGFYSKKLIKFKTQGITGVIDKGDVKVITSKGLGYLMSPIWQATYFQGTTFVVAVVLGPTSVTIFNTVRTLTRAVNQVFNMLDAIMFPEMQYEIGLGNINKAAKLFRLAIWLSFIMALGGVVFLLFFGMWFYNFWTNNKITVDPVMWNILIIGILFNALWWTAGVVFRAVNQPYKFTLAGSIGAVLSVVVAYFLAGIWGLAGVAVGCLVLDVVMAFYALPAGCRLLNMSVGTLVKQGFTELSEVGGLIKSKLKPNKI